MKVRVYSQWMEDVFVPARIKQLTKAARMLGHTGFHTYAAGHDMVDLSPSDRKLTEREVVEQWLNDRANATVPAEGVA